MDGNDRGIIVTIPFIIMFGCCAVSCVYALYRDIKQQCCREKNTNQIRMDNSDSDSEEEYISHNYSYTERLGIQQASNRVITSYPRYYSDSDSDSDSEEECIKENIQTKQIKTFSNINKYSKFCSICQEDKLNTIKTNCDHDFCKECINEHIKNYKNCPICRKNIKCIYEIEVLIFK